MDQARTFRNGEIYAGNGKRRHAPTRLERVKNGLNSFAWQEFETQKARAVVLVYSRLRRFFIDEIRRRTSTAFQAYKPIKQSLQSILKLKKHWLKDLESKMMKL